MMKVTYCPLDCSELLYHRNCVLFPTPPKKDASQMIPLFDEICLNPKPTTIQHLISTAIS